MTQARVVGPSKPRYRLDDVAHLAAVSQCQQIRRCRGGGCVVDDNHFVGLASLVCKRSKAAVEAVGALARCNHYRHPLVRWRRRLIGRWHGIGRPNGRNEVGGMDDRPWMFEFQDHQRMGSGTHKAEDPRIGECVRACQIDRRKRAGDVDADDLRRAETLCAHRLLPIRGTVARA